MKLITWNIQWGLGIDGRVDLDRIVDHAKRFADFDVLCLQEVSSGYPELDGNDGSDQFAGIARRLPGYTALRGTATDLPGCNGERCGFGNMMLSRLPVKQVYRHLLPWPAEPGIKSMQRMALEATIAAPSGLIRVTTTHLEYFSPTQRRAQIARLRELQREGYAHAHNTPSPEPPNGPFASPPRGGPSVITGDFNFRPGTPDHAAMIAPFDDLTPAYRDAWQVLHGSRPHPPTVGLHDKAQWPDEPFTFDFIFVSADLATSVKDVRVDAATNASDHQPVLLELG